jgi:hypothetical protein
MLALTLEHHYPAVDIIFWDTLDNIQCENRSAYLEIRMLEIPSATCNRLLVSAGRVHSQQLQRSSTRRTHFCHREYTHSGIEPNDFKELQAM